MNTSLPRAKSEDNCFSDKNSEAVNIIPPPILEEIVKNNTLLDTTISKYEEEAELHKKLGQLHSAKIKPVPEMEGEGLRRTYIAIGREWLEDVFVDRWSKEAKDIRKNIILLKCKKVANMTLVPLVYIIAVIIYAYAFYNGVKPGFGTGMKKVRVGSLEYDDLSRFAGTIFSEIREKDDFNRFKFIQRQLPPEVTAIWRNHFSILHKSSSMSVNKIFADPVRKGVFHLKCQAFLPDHQEIDFRLQCAENYGRYVFVAIE